MPLADLVHDSAHVLRTWPDSPALHPHPAGAFDHLVTLAEVERLIDGNCLPCRAVALIDRRGHIVKDTGTYSRDGDMPNPGALRQHLDNGGSISLRLMETVFPSLADFYRDLCEETGYTGHVSGYLTPPGSQGFRYHYDPYTSLIVQVAGEKDWPVHPPVVDSPVEEFGDFRTRGFTEDERNRQAITAPCETFTLRPGDVLWLPQGWVHSPHNRKGAVPSFHLTIALKPRNLHWAVARVAAVIADHVLNDPDGRRPLAPADLLGDAPAVSKSARSCMLDALAAIDDDAMGAFLRRAALPDMPARRGLPR